MKLSARHEWPAAIACACFFFATGFESALAQEFTYNGDTGPGYWSGLSSDWGACSGVAPDARQSPIDIVDVKKDRSLKPLALTSLPTAINITNNGHTIEQEYEGTGSAISFEGKHYELQQFHFHTLSEHAVEGEQGDMELHAVFQASDGTRLVVGMLFDAGKKANTFIQTLIDAGLPKKSGDTTKTSTLINLVDALTSRSSYFTYPGSLTTPPCTANVTWVVLAERAHLSQAQLESFRRILGNDFRPLQHRNGRVVRATEELHSHTTGREGD